MQTTLETSLTDRQEQASPPAQGWLFYAVIVAASAVAAILGSPR